MTLENWKRKKEKKDIRNLGGVFGKVVMRIFRF